MRLFHNARYSLLALVITLAGIYLIALKQGLQAIVDIWEMFRSLCIATSYTFINYLFIHDRFASTFIIMVSSIGLIWALIYCIRQAHHTKRLQRQLDAKHPTLFKKASTLLVVDDDRPFALTAGFLKPRIYISRKLEQILSEKELACVVAHEEQHRANRDALLSLGLEILSRLLFFIPSLPSLVRYLHLRQELIADAAALQNSAPHILASAILKSVDHRTLFTPPGGVAVGFSTMSERVTYLINPSLRPVLRLSRLSLGLSAGMMFIVMLAITSFKPNDIHAQAINTEGLMSKVIIEHCKAEDASYFPFSLPVRSEMNRSVISIR